jgi:hypothetical protein
VQTAGTRKAVKISEENNISFLQKDLWLILPQKIILDTLLD